MVQSIAPEFVAPDSVSGISLGEFQGYATRARDKGIVYHVYSDQTYFHFYDPKTRQVNHSHSLNMGINDEGFSQTNLAGDLIAHERDAVARLINIGSILIS